MEVLERDVEDALLLVAPHVVDDHDAGVGQARRDAGFGQETALVLLALAGRAAEGEADGLEGDGPAEGGVVGLVDHAHHASAELLADLVPADLGGRVAQGGICSHGSH